MENSFNLDNFIKATTYFATIKDSANIYKEANQIFKNFFNVNFSMFIKKNNSYEILETFSKNNIDTFTMLEKFKKYIDEIYRDGFLISDIIDEFFIVALPININNKVTSIMLIGVKEPISKDGLNILLSISKSISLFLEKQVTKNIFNILSENVPEMLYRFVRTKSKEKRFEYVGKGSKIVLGYLPEEIIKNPNLCFNNIDKRDRINFLRTIVKSIKTNQKLTVTLRWIGENKDTQFIQINAMVMKKNGEIIFNGAISNITKQILTHQKIEKLEYQNRLILNSAGEGIFGLDENGMHTFVNPAAAKMLGYKVNELIGKKSHLTWHYKYINENEYLENNCPIYKSKQEAKSYFGDNEYFIKKDGTLFPVEYIATPIIQEAKVIGSVIIFKDITDRKKTEAILKSKQKKITSLLKKEHFLRELLEIIAKVNELLIISSSIEKLLNDSCIELAKYKKYKLVNIILNDENKFYSNKNTSLKDDIKSEKEFLTTLKLNKVLEFKIKNLQNIKLSKDLGEINIKSLISIPLKQNIFSKPFGILLVFNRSIEFLKDERKILIELAGDIGFAINSFRQKEDLIELNKNLEKRVAIEVQKQREQEKFLIQQSKLAAMGEMIGNIAHQWRQPLNLLGLQIQDMAEAYEYGELNKEYINKIVSKTMNVLERMSHTIDDFRNFFEPNKKKKSFSIKSAIEKSISIIEASLKNNFINLEVNIIDDIEVFGFENEYSQVLLNILNNAKDALKESSVKDKKIVIEAKKENSKSIVSVSDNGGGIPLEIIEKIYEPYFTTKHKSQGTGIGLYMSKMIIEKSMKGDLKVQNINLTGEKGAKFIIEI